MTTQPNKLTKSLILLALLIVSSITSAIVPKTEATREHIRDLMNRYHMPSMSIAISIEGDLVFAQALGYANVEAKTPATTHTQYDVASIAKPMTSIALGLLIDQGKIALDTPIHRHMPNYPELARGITMGQLASHTSGIEHTSPERDVYEYGEAAKDQHSPHDVLGFFAHKPLRFKPGTGFKYSSAGYILLSAAIEKVAKRNFIDHMQQTLWQTLGMHSTELHTSKAGLKHEAQYYSRTETGELVAASGKRDRSFLFGAGGFISTPSDLVKLSEVFARKGFLSEPTKRAMLTPAKLADGSPNPQSYGLGWSIGQLPGMTPNGQALKVASHWGLASKAAVALLMVVPEHNAAIAFATNSQPQGFLAIERDISQMLLGYLNPKPPVPAPSP